MIQSLKRTKPVLTVAAGLLAAAISGALAVLVLNPVADPVSLAPAAMANLAESGLGNPVAGVLFVYRSFDTLLEKVVLLIALLGVWSFASDDAWNDVPGLRIFPKPDGILTLLAQTLPPLGIMVALYTCWIGASEPGGAFQGGAVLAAMWLLVMIAGLRPVPTIGTHTIRLAMAVGPCVFAVIGTAGIFLAGSFLAYPPGYAKPLIVVIEVTLTLVDRRDSGPARSRCSTEGAAVMNVIVLYGICAATLVGLGLFGLIVNQEPLRKILALNLLGSGVFMMFGVIARRGAAAGLGGDPVPQAMIITAIVVAFSATAVAVALLLRLSAYTGGEVEPGPEPPGSDTPR